MLKLLKIAAAIALAALYSGMENGCSSPKPPPISPSDTNFYVSAKINGVNMRAERTNISGLYVVSDLRIIARAVASNQIKEEITLDVEDFIGVGTYTLNAQNVGTYSNVAGGITYATNGQQIGNIFVSEFNNGIIVGTFTFQARSGLGQVVAVTEGKFRVAVSQ